jgi:hypothetical protein
MANTLELGNGKWATGKDTVLAFNDENNNFKPLPFNFSRASNATVVNKAGLIGTVGSGEPRIDFSNDAKGALLLEPTRMNLVTYSEAFDNAYWTKSNTTVTSGFVSPDGTNNAFKLTSNNGGNIISRPSLTLNTTHTTSIYLKRVSGTGNVSIFKTNGNETVVTLTSEWQRFTDINSVNPSNAYTGVRLYGLSDEVLIYAAQVEQGSYATSYIPTSGSAATRVADVCSEGGNSTLFNNNSFTIFSEFIRDGFDTDSAGVALGLRNPSNSEQIRLHFDAPTKFVRFRDALNGFATIGGYIPISLNEKIKLSLSVNGSTAKVFSNGVQVGSDYTGITPFNIDEMVLNGRLWKVKDVRYYNTALTDAELIALTK